MLPAVLNISGSGRYRRKKCRPRRSGGSEIQKQPSRSCTGGQLGSRYGQCRCSSECRAVTCWHAYGQVLFKRCASECVHLFPDLLVSYKLPLMSRLCVVLGGSSLDTPEPQAGFNARSKQGYACGEIATTRISEFVCASEISCHTPLAGCVRTRNMMGAGDATEACCGCWKDWWQPFLC